MSRRERAQLRAPAVQGAHRAPAAQAPIRLPAGESVSVPLGVAIGLALGSAVFSATVRLDTAYYHYGGFGPTPVLQAMTVDAALHWLATAAGGAVAGWVLGVLLRRVSAAVLARLATASAGLYVLALRGAWGFAGPTAAAPRVLAGPPLPGTALLVPSALVLVSVVALFMAARRTPAPSRTSAWGLAGAQLLMSLGAALCVTRLPYEASRWPAFLAGLSELIGLATH